MDIKEICENLDRVQEIIDLSRQQNLEVEVIWFAMRELKNNSELSIIEALEHGFNEFMK